MISLSQYSGKTLAILGLGKTGMAAAEALKAAGATLYLWDDMQTSCEALPVGLASAVIPIEDWPWEALDALVLSPGIPLTYPAPHAAVTLARQHHVPITSDIELLYDACPEATCIAITGTNGKSTTTALIGHILHEAGCKAQVGGNIGMPALALDPPLNLPPEGGEGERSESEGGETIYVLELSSFQLDLLQHTRFNIAVWLNISADHLDRHGDMEGYVAAKHHIFDRQTADDVAIIGVDDPYSEAVARQLIAEETRRVVPVSVSQRCAQGVWVKDGVLHYPPVDLPPEGGEGEPRRAEGGGFDLNDLASLRGTHNHQNAAAAYAACRAAGLSHEAIAAGMASFPGLAHRMQRVAERDGVVFINDSKATNADAAARSLGSYDDIYWIAGGVAKAGGIESLARYFPRIRRAYLIGAAQDAFAETLQGQVEYVKSGTLDTAVQQASSDAKAAGGGVVLLAPACASFDQFANFEVRGEAFVEAVNRVCHPREGGNLSAKDSRLRGNDGV